MAGTASPAAAFDAHGTLGALSVGVLISCFLFGIVTVQTYMYYARFPEDSMRLKTLVAVVWLFELAHCISICHSLYSLTISSYGNPRALVKPPSTLFLAIIFSGIIGPIVQAFFADRVRVISGQLIIPIICWSLSAARLAMSFFAASEAFEMTTLAQYQKECKWVLTTVLAIGATVDIIVAASLCFFLRTQRADSLVKTARMIDNIIAWTIQTGTMTSLTGLIMLVCFLAMPGNFVWLAFFMFLARMFSNSLLASLNARSVFRSKTNVVELQHPSGGGTYTGNNIGPYPLSQVSVRMPRFTEVATAYTKADPNYNDMA